MEATTNESRWNDNPCPLKNKIAKRGGAQTPRLVVQKELGARPEMCNRRARLALALRQRALLGRVRVARAVGPESGVEHLVVP